MLEPAALLGLAMLGVVLALVELLIIVVTLPFVRHLPRAQVVQFVPPQGSVIHHGLMVRSDRRLLAAAIIELAVAKKVRLLTMPGARRPIAIEVPPDAPITAADFRFLRALRPQLYGKRVARYLGALAEIGVHVTSIDDAPNVIFLKGKGAFRKQQREGISQFFDETRAELVAQGFTRKRPVSLHLYLLSLLFLAACLVSALLVFGALLEGAWIGAIVVILIVAGLFGVLTIAPPPLLRFTPLGTDLRRDLSGLRDYVRLAEQDRLRILQSPQGALRLPAGALTPGGVALGLTPAPTTGDPVAQAGLDRFLLIEQLLPYVVLFRCEKQWQREFDQIGNADVAAQNLRALEATFNGIAATYQAIAIVLQVMRLFGFVLALFGGGKR